MAEQQYDENFNPNLEGKDAHTAAIVQGDAAVRLVEAIRTDIKARADLVKNVCESYGMKQARQQASSRLAIFSSALAMLYMSDIICEADYRMLLEEARVQISFSNCVEA